MNADAAPLATVEHGGSAGWRPAVADLSAQLLAFERRHIAANGSAPTKGELRAFGLANGFVYADGLGTGWAPSWTREVQPTDGDRPRPDASPEDRAAAWVETLERLVADGRGLAAVRMAFFEVYGDGP